MRHPNSGPAEITTEMVEVQFDEPVQEKLGVDNVKECEDCLP